MSYAEQFENAAAVIRVAVEQAASALSGMCAEVTAATSNVEAGIVQALCDFADMEDEKTRHFARFAEETSKPYEEQSEECRADWSRVCTVSWEVTRRLEGYAFAVRNARRDESPAPTASGSGGETP